MSDIKVKLSDQQLFRLNVIATSFGITRQSVIKLLVDYYYEQVMPSNEIAAKTLEAKSGIHPLPHN